MATGCTTCTTATRATASGADSATTTGAAGFVRVVVFGTGGDFEVECGRHGCVLRSKVRLVLRSGGVVAVLRGMRLSKGLHGGALLLRNEVLLRVLMVLLNRRKRDGAHGRAEVGRVHVMMKLSRYLMSQDGLLVTRHVRRQELVVKAILEVADAFRDRMLAVSWGLAISSLYRATAKTDTTAEDTDIAVVVGGVVALDWSLGCGGCDLLGDVETEHRGGTKRFIAGILVLLIIVKEASTGEAFGGVSDRGVVDGLAVIVLAGSAVGGCD